MKNGMSAYISKPRTAFFGAAIFGSFWFVIGAFNDFLLVPTYVLVNKTGHINLLNFHN